MNKQTFSSQCHEDGSITIKSGARLSIEHAVDFARCIGEALASCQWVTLEFDADVEVDVTALQILCSACKTATVEGKTFTRKGPRPDSLFSLLQAAGAERHGLCRHNSGNPCIWFGGNEERSST